MKQSTSTSRRPGIDVQTEADISKGHLIDCFGMRSSIRTILIPLLVSIGLHAAIVMATIQRSQKPAHVEIKNQNGLKGALEEYLKNQQNPEEGWRKLLDLYIEADSNDPEISDVDKLKAKKIVEAMVRELEEIKAEKGDNEVDKKIAEWMGTYDYSQTNLIKLILEEKGNCKARMKLGVILKTAVPRKSAKDIKIVVEGKDQYGNGHLYVAEDLGNGKYTVINGANSYETDEKKLGGVAVADSQIMVQAVAEATGNEDLVKQKPEVKIVKSNQKKSESEPEVDEEIEEKFARLEEHEKQTGVRDLFQIGQRILPAFSSLAETYTPREIAAEMADPKPRPPRKLKYSVGEEIVIRVVSQREYYEMAAVALGVQDFSSEEERDSKLEEFYKKSIEIDPENEDAYRDYAWLKIKQNKPIEAVESLLQGLELEPSIKKDRDPKKAQIVEILLNLYVNNFIEVNVIANEQERAKLDEIFQNKIRENPKSVAAYIGYISYLIDHNAFDKAKEIYQQALKEIDTENENAIAAVRYVYAINLLPEEADDPEEAEKVYKKILEIYPQGYNFVADSIERRVNQYRAEGDFNKAVRFLEIVAKFIEKDLADLGQEGARLSRNLFYGAAIKELGMYYRKSGHFDKVEELYKRMLLLDPDNDWLSSTYATEVFMEADKYLAAGNFDKANELFVKALEIDPDNDRLHKLYEAAINEKYPEGYKRKQGYVSYAFLLIKLAGKISGRFDYPEKQSMHAIRAFYDKAIESAPDNPMMQWFYIHDRGELYAKYPEIYKAEMEKSKTIIKKLIEETQKDPSAMLEKFKKAIKEMAGESLNDTRIEIFSYKVILRSLEIYSHFMDDKYSEEKEELRALANIANFEVTLLEDLKEKAETAMDYFDKIKDLE